MILRKLPFEVQSKISASAQIRNYKTAVEELVYNALDANSSCIAIRINIQENYIQVVDNGHGVANDDFKILGQRHTTSKFENSSTSEYIPKYGRWGQSLANLIEVSESVKIISRFKNSNTYKKHFCNGKEDECSVTAERPSVGTTVEVKGFLYNLAIQKKVIKALEEYQNIKTFLEQISLVHCNTSISLRDNYENEIMLKIHKNRNIMQTLISGLNFEPGNLRELKVEKNKYQVTGFIQNNGGDSRGYQWIYVNGRFINKSNLHKIVNGYFTKGVPGKNKNNTKGHNNEDEQNIPNKKLPDYFMFIKCPQNDYDLIFSPKQSFLQFKNVLQIKKLLEKLVKFYMGNINLTKEAIDNLEPRDADEFDTRNKVKQIIQKILGTQQRKMSGSDLRNGVKGKIIKRKIKKKVIRPSNSKLKPKDRSVNVLRNMQDFPDSVNDHYQTSPNNNIIIDNDATSYSVTTNKQNKKEGLVNTNQTQLQKEHHSTKNMSSKKYGKIRKDPVLVKFEKQTNEVQNRCNILEKKVDHLLGIKKTRKCKIYTTETLRFSNILRNNKSISIRKKIKEILIHEYLPLPQKSKATNYNENSFNVIKKSYDLIRPITNIVNLKYNDIPSNYIRPKTAQPHQSDSCTLQVTDPVESNIPGPTYESHCYRKESLLTRPKYDLLEKRKISKFISKTSRDRCASVNAQDNMILERKIIKKHKNTKAHGNINSGVLAEEIKSSYSLYFTKTESQIKETQQNAVNASDINSFSEKFNVGSTYTVEDLIKSGTPKNFNNTSARTYILDTFGDDDVNRNKTSNVNLNDEVSICIRKTQNEYEVTSERVDSKVIFISNSQRSKTKTNDIEPLHFCETIIDCHHDRDHEEYSFIFDSINNISEINLPSFMTIQEINGMVSNLNYNKGEKDSNLNINSQKIFDDCKQNGNNFESNGFNLKNRRRYIPKGLSPIFENCNLKKVCNFKFDKDYFEEKVYDKFVQNVQKKSEIFEPMIQNVTEATTGDIQRADNKWNKDNACYIFNGESIKQATVLGQVDNKFIATIIRGKSNGAHDCLVLFDQHAVHERIRLEKNMSGYIDNGQWKSIAVDAVSLKLTRDEILYLHNYRDKFQRLGLQWNVASDTHVFVNAIPEAILGKHSRQVDVVLKAVKSLIKEEINIIKEQGGCYSLYPKSIMDLVFSEACRYAVMFGDALSAQECVSLIDALASCGTPFQCAHGRPAMAVLVNIVQETRVYE